MRWFRYRPSYSDGEIALIPVRIYPAQEDLGFGREYSFMVVPYGKRREAGQISVRLGQSEGVYYYGHIGYHIDEPYRGRHWAEKACRLIEPLLKENGLHSAVITCDPDNWPSIRTCERLGCTLERTVPVAGWLQRKYDISAAKRRYIWRIK